MVIYFILGILILPAIIYFTVRGAVEEGTYSALIKFEEHKQQDEKKNN